MKPAKQPRCLALTKAGDQCRQYAARGSDFCGAHGPRAGRTTKLTDNLIAALADQARLGLYRSQIAELAGVDTRTLYRWLEAGAADEEAGKDSVYVRLRHALTRAEAEAEASMVDAVRQAALGVEVEAFDANGDPLENVRVHPDWRAAAFYLERRYPHRYGRRDKVTLDEGASKPGDAVEVTPASDEARAAIAAILERAGALNEDG